MTLKASTGLRNGIAVTGSLKNQLDLGFLNIYAGSVPSDADASLGAAILLCTITKDGDGVTGLTFAATASGGAVSKANEVWSGTNVATGTATFYRFVLTGDTGGLSTTEKRIQGSAATSGADLVMTSVNLANGAPQSIDFYSLAFPA